MTSPINPNPVTEDAVAAQLKAKRLRKRRWRLRSLVGAIVIVAIVWGLYHLQVGRWYEGTHDS
jgi:membrane protease YdiL (CAAX protease family)